MEGRHHHHHHHHHPTPLASSLHATFVRSSPSSALTNSEHGDLLNLPHANSSSPFGAASSHAYLISHSSSLSSSASPESLLSSAHMICPHGGGGGGGSGADSLVSSEPRVEYFSPAAGSLLSSESRVECFSRGVDRKTEVAVEQGFVKCSKGFSESNVGFRLLRKSGWKEGTGLGVSEQGRLEPVQTDVKLDRRGIGAEKKLKQIGESVSGQHCQEIFKTKAQKVISKKLRKAQLEEQRLQEQAFARSFLREFWPDNV